MLFSFLFNIKNGYIMSLYLFLTKKIIYYIILSFYWNSCLMHCSWRHEKDFSSNAALCSYFPVKVERSLQWRSTSQGDRTVERAAETLPRCSVSSRRQLRRYGVIAALFLLIGLCFVWWLRVICIFFLYRSVPAICSEFTRALDLRHWML